MRELIAVARNIVATKKDDGTYEDRLELILVVSEPNYRMDASGRLINERGQLETMRILMSCGGVKHVIEALTEYLAEIEQVKES